MRFPRIKRSQKRTFPSDVELGPPPDAIHHQDQEALSQHSPTSNGALLNLPVEIRLEILRHIFSHHLIHVFIARTCDDDVDGGSGAQFGWPQGRVKTKKPATTKPRVRSLWCSQSCSYRFNDTHEHEDSHHGRGRHDPPWPPPELLAAGSGGHHHAVTAVLLSCHQLHAEALDLIYTTNIFDFISLLPFGEFATQFPSPLSRIRYLQARHKVPTLGAYARHDPPAGLRAAVKVSWDGPAMFCHFVACVMPQLKGMRLLLERCWMTIEYEGQYSKRHAEWVRFLTQLGRFPGVGGQPAYVRGLGMKWDPALQALDD